MKNENKITFAILKERISPDNVLAMSELIAISETKFLIGYMGERMYKLHKDLYIDIKHKNDVNYTLSNAYDLVQECGLFLCQHFGAYLKDIIGYNKKGNGSGGLGSGRRITNLIEFCERNDNKSNCRGLAILLAALLRLNGIKAQHITCLPYEDPFEDCHVVVDCLLPSGKRIMLDPTWRLYLKDKEGNYVSLSHLRELLLADEPIFENPTADYNGTGFAKEYHRNYMIKNTFRFARCTMNKDGVDGRTETSR